MSKTHPSLGESKNLNTEERRRHVFALASDLEEPLDQALAFANALALMAFGLRNIADNYGPSFLAIAEAMTGQLNGAKSTWQQIIDASKHKPRAIFRRTAKFVPTTAIRRARHKQRLDT